MGLRIGLWWDIERVEVYGFGKSGGLVIYKARAELFCQYDVSYILLSSS